MKIDESYPPELQQARAAIWELAKFGGQNTQLAMRYIGLFAPVNDKLPFEQIYRLLCEINNICLDCPAEHWQKAVQSILDDKVSGSLKTPLINHDILLERLVETNDFFGDDDEPIKPNIPPKSPDPPPRKFVPRTEQQKAQAASHVQNMMAVLNQANPFHLKEKL